MSVRLSSLLLGAALLAAPALVPGASAQPAPRGFEQWDPNHDGRITWEEGWQSVQRLFAAADTNHDGGLSLEEWMAARLPGQPQNRPAAPQRRQEWRAALFRALDADRDGRVTLEEIRPVAEAWFRALDANADGALTPDEIPHTRGRQPQPR
jgi:Ca2+-binding EF-hand superfamily protein